MKNVLPKSYSTQPVVFKCNNYDRRYNYPGGELLQYSFSFCKPEHSLWGLWFTPVTAWLVVLEGWLFVCLCASLWVTLSPCPSPQSVDSEGFTHLPPEQRRKRLQQKIDDISKELQKEMDQRWVGCHSVSSTTIAMTTGHSWIHRVAEVWALFTKLFRSLRNQWCWVPQVTVFVCSLSFSVTIKIALAMLNKYIYVSVQWGSG